MTDPRVSEEERRRKLGDRIVKLFADGWDLETLINEYGSKDVTGFLRRGFQILAEAQAVPQAAIEGALIEKLLAERTALEAKLAEARREFANECWAKISEIQATEYGRTGYHAIVVAFRQWLKDNGAAPPGAQIHMKEGS